MSAQGSRTLLRCRSWSERLHAKGFTGDQIAEVPALHYPFSPLRLYRLAHGGPPPASRTSSTPSTRGARPRCARAACWTSSAGPTAAAGPPGASWSRSPASTRPLPGTW
jgi:hypothetical protein